MAHLVYIACGGAAGAVTRYLVSKHINSMFDTALPYGTLCVNTAGALVIGFLFALFEYTIVSREMKGLLSVGFLGALTTFSTFSLETVTLLRQGEYINGLFNIILNVVLSLIMVVAGMKLFELYISMIKR